MLQFLILFSILLIQSNGLEIVSQIPTQFGESPHWDAKTESLYYVDFFGDSNQLLRYDYNEDRLYAAKIVPEQKNPGFIIPVEGCKNQFMVGFQDRRVRIVYWDGRAPTAVIMETLFEVEQSSEYSNNLWHLAKADPMGRFYGKQHSLSIFHFSFRMFFSILNEFNVFLGGTMDIALCTKRPNAAAYRFIEGVGAKTIIDGISVSNGFEWDKKK